MSGSGCGTLTVKWSRDAQPLVEAATHIVKEADSGQSPDRKVLYMVRWETLPSNHDSPRDPIPPPTQLRLYGFRSE